MNWLIQLFKKLFRLEIADNLPQHIAIIMDGNGRWAQRRGLPRIVGHRMGASALKRVVRICGELGIKYLSVYAFSTENWERPKDEVDFLMTLFSETIEAEIDELMKMGVKLRFMGRLSRLSKDLQEKMSDATEKTAGNKGLNLNIMINYGGRAELVDAFKEICSELKGENIDEEIIPKHLYTRDIPDPDLLIRTAGEMRISNFLLWQIAYTEIWFTETLWPDFDRKDLKLAIRDYQGRTRRFGRI